MQVEVSTCGGVGGGWRNAPLCAKSLDLARLYASWMIRVDARETVRELPDRIAGRAVRSWPHGGARQDRTRVA
jgi:hypothetical protein